jgi:hypothetical protein
VGFSVDTDQHHLGTQLFAPSVSKASQLEPKPKRVLQRERQAHCNIVEA